MIVRRAGAGDVPDMAALEQECFSRPWSAASLEAEVSGGNTVFFVALLDGETAGYAGMQFAADEGSVFNIAVAERFRRRGVGRALTAALSREAASLGLASVFLEVRPSNLAAISLYEKAGYVFCGLRRDYYDSPKENAIMMKLSLDGGGEREDPVEGWPSI